MEKQGVVERHAYQERPPRHEYRLTAKGKDLFDVLYAMRNWAERWAYEEGETGGARAMRYTHRARSEEHTSELQSLMRISYAVFCLKKNNNTITHTSLSY